MAQLLPMRERISGPEHPSKLAAPYKFARWTGRAGDPAAARDPLANSRPMYERVLGPEYLDTLAIRSNLANEM
jgi:hypothetical protein